MKPPLILNLTTHRQGASVTEFGSTETDSAIDQACNQWDRLVRDQPDVDDWVEEQLSLQEQLGQAPKGVPLCRVARPNFSTAHSVASDQALLGTVADAIVGAAEAILVEPALADRYLGDWLRNDGHEAAVRVDPGYREPMVVGRFDTALTADGMRILEFNGGMPGGMANTEAAADLMTGWEVFDRFNAERPDSPAHAEPVLKPAFEAMLSAWQDFGGSGSALAVLAMPDEFLPIAAAHIPGFVATSAELGHELVVADPGRLVYANGRVTLDGRRVDVVIRGFLSEMLGMLGQRVQPLLAAVAAGDVCMVTSMRSGVYGHKALFAALTDPSLDLGLVGTQREAALEHLPWTRVVTDSTTTGPNGEVVGLPEFMESARERLVVKPANGFAGMGVHLGWEETPEQWSAAVAHALADGAHIVQDRIDVPTQEYPELAPGLPTRRYVADHNPIMANRRVIGYLTRLSMQGGITNVSSGAGTLTPTLHLG